MSALAMKDGKIETIVNTSVTVFIIAGLSIQIIKRFFVHAKSALHCASIGKRNYKLAGPIKWNKKFDFRGTVRSLLSGKVYECECTVRKLPIESHADIYNLRCNCGSVTDTNDETNKYCSHSAFWLTTLIDDSDRSTPLHPFDPLLFFDQRCCNIQSKFRFASTFFLCVSKLFACLF